MAAARIVRQRWQLLIGSFILTFGEIEHSVHLMWKRAFGSKPEPQSFQARVDKLIGRIKDNTSLSQALPGLLIEAKALWEYRNTVAHHPLSLQVYRHEVSRKITPVLRVASRSGDTSVTEVELRRFCEQAERVAREIESAFWWHEIEGDA